MTGSRILIVLLLVPIVIVLTTLTAIGENGSPPLPLPQYKVTELGTLGDASYSQAIGMNNSGYVVGALVFSPPGGGNYARAFLYKNGTMIDLGTVEGMLNTTGTAVNSMGQVVGDFDTPDRKVHCFLYSGRTMVDIGTLGGSYCTVSAINSRGQVVGQSKTSTGEIHAFLYDNGAMMDLGTLGGTQSGASAINESGQVVGSSSDNLDGWQAFLYKNGAMMDLGTLGSRFGAAGINDRGQIVGWVYSPTGTRHASLYSDGTMIDLGTLAGGSSEAFSINNRGEVVGVSDMATSWYPLHAFIYTDGKMMDLNDLIPANPRVVLNYGRVINDRGEIIADGWSDLNGNDMRDGDERFGSFILTPIR